MPSGRFPAAFFCPRAGLLSPWREGTAPTPREAEGAAQRRRDEAWVENRCASGGRGAQRRAGPAFPGEGRGFRLAEAGKGGRRRSRSEKRGFCPAGPKNKTRTACGRRFWGEGGHGARCRGLGASPKPRTPCVFGRGVMKCAAADIGESPAPRPFCVPGQGEDGIAKPRRGDGEREGAAQTPVCAGGPGRA